MIVSIDDNSSVREYSWYMYQQCIVRCIICVSRHQYNPQIWWIYYYDYYGPYLLRWLTNFLWYNSDTYIIHCNTCIDRSIGRRNHRCLWYMYQQCIVQCIICVSRHRYNPQIRRTSSFSRRSLLLLMIHSWYIHNTMWYMYRQVAREAKPPVSVIHVS